MNAILTRTRNEPAIGQSFRTRNGMNKAWVARTAKQPMVLETVDLGPLGAEDVEVAVEHCGLCHSDLSVLNNEWGISQYPAILGHEVIGRITAVGPNAKGLKVGQRVGVGWNSGSCMHCHQCMSGSHHLCPEVQATIVGHRGGLKDVARIELGAAEYDVIGRFNGKPTAVLALYQLPGSNAIEAANGVRKLMAELKSRFPADLDYEIPIDTTKAVIEGIREIGTTFWEALALVMIVVFVFLQGWRAALIPLLAVPVSLVGTFAIFPLLGFSINTLSLFGLVLAIRW